MSILIINVASFGSQGYETKGKWSRVELAAEVKVPPRSLDKRNSRLLLAPLLLVHLLNLLFHDANGLVKPVRVTAHPVDFNGRKPLAGVLRRLAQWLEMSGPHQERQVIFQPTWHCRRDVTQLPLRMGGTRQDRRLPGKVRAGGVGTQQQGRASRLCETGIDENSIAGRLRTAGRREALSGGVNAAPNAPGWTGNCSAGFALLRLRGRPQPRRQRHRLWTPSSARAGLNPGHALSSIALIMRFERLESERIKRANFRGYCFATWGRLGDCSSIKIAA
jgi:hypothetical protein